jgi:acetyltransferase-like isoleucine patch superfamily enzyme
MSKYYIFGNGQFAELIKLLIVEEKKIKENKIFFVTKKKIDKKNYIDEENFFLLGKKKFNVFIGLGDIDKRIKLIKKLKSKKYKFPNFVSKTAKVFNKCSLGIGNIILPYSVVLPPSKIGNFNILGTNTTLLHHGDVANNCLIGGGCTIGAGTKIANNTFIGVGCTIASRNLKIGSSCFISSGSVLFNSIQSKTKIIGNPARKIL